MNKVKASFIALVCLLSVGVANGQVKKEERKVESFSKISVSNAIDVEYTQDKKISVTVEADESIIGLLSTEVKNGTLYVKMKEELRNNSGRNKKRKVYLSAPLLDKVQISGASDFYAAKMEMDTDFQLNASGASDTKISHLSARSVNINISGASDFDGKEITLKDKINLNASGASDTKIDNLEASNSAAITISGGSDCIIKKIKTKKGELSASGGSDATLNFVDSGKVSANATGGSDVVLSGKVDGVNLACSGASDANIKNLSYNTIEINTSKGSDVKK